MPHMCDECERSFPNGSKQMLSGCPDCGGNKFQYVADGTTPKQQEPEPTADDSDIIEADPTTSTEDNAQRAARGEIIEPDEVDAEYTGSMSDLVSGLQQSGSDEESDAAAEDDGAAPEMFEPDDESDATHEGLSGADEDATDPSTNVDALRDELLDQFESINILEPGSYELNLVKLYEREEHIIQIQEDGKYVIQMPER